MTQRIIRSVCNLLLLEDEQERAQHMNDNLESSSLEYGTNSVQNMFMYNYPGRMNVMLYDKPNRHHHDRLAVIQTSNQELKPVIQVQAMGKLIDTSVSSDGFPVRTVSIPGYLLMLINGDAAQPNRYTVRITKRPLEEEDLDVGVKHFIQGKQAFNSLTDMQQAAQCFNLCTHHNPFAPGGRYFYGCALFNLATKPYSIVDQSLLRQAETEFKISRVLGQEHSLVESALESCNHYRKQI